MKRTRELLSKLRHSIGGIYFAGLALLAAGFVTVAVAQGFQPPMMFFNGTRLSPSIAGQDNSAGLYFGTGFAGVSRHWASGSIAANNLPVVSNAGATPLLTAGSTDTAGQFSSTAATTTATLTFGTAWNTAPVCVVQEQGGAVAPTYTVTTVAIVVTVLVAATNYNYICMGMSNG